MEQVLVADRAAFFAGEWPQGFVALEATQGARLVTAAERASRFVPRELAEHSPELKQWIPYCVVRCYGRGPRPADGTVHGAFLVRRGARQSETRLHGLWSIGLGGHVNPPDAVEPGSTRGAIGRALWRELREELHLDLPEAVQPQLLGVLNDDSTPVGSVHAGLVYSLDLDVALPEASNRVRIREISKMTGGFGSLAEFANLWQDPGQFETWSQFLIGSRILGRMATSAPLQSPPEGSPADSGRAASARDGTQAQ